VNPTHPLSPPTVCPADCHDRLEERVSCMWEEHIPGAWAFICRGCWEALVNARARRKEWEVD
jgi:hypothetical protein